MIDVLNSLLILLMASNKGLKPAYQILIFVGMLPYLILGMNLFEIILKRPNFMHTNHIVQQVGIFIANYIHILDRSERAAVNMTNLQYI